MKRNLNSNITTANSKTEKKTCTLYSRHVDLLTNRIKCASSVADLIMSFNKCCKEVKMRDYKPRFDQVCRRRVDVHDIFCEEGLCANFRDDEDNDVDPECLSCPFCVDWPLADNEKRQCDTCRRPLCTKCQTKHPCTGCDGKRFFCSRCVEVYGNVVKKISTGPPINDPPFGPPWLKACEKCYNTHFPIGTHGMRWYDQFKNSHYIKCSLLTSLFPNR